MILIDPFPGCYDAADPYGNSKPPRSYAHTGSDWIVAAGRAVPAIGAGVVVNRQWHAGNGNTVTIRLDGSDLFYAYLHLAEPAAVAVGERVQLGQTVGEVGATGTNARGAHLHVTVSDAPTAYVGLGRRQDPWALIQSAITTTAASSGIPLTPEVLMAMKDTLEIFHQPERGYFVAGGGFYYPIGDKDNVNGQDKLNALAAIGVPIRELPAGDDGRRLYDRLNIIFAGNQYIYSTASAVKS